MSKDSSSAQEEPVLLTPKELARRLRLSLTTVYRLAEQRKIPFYRISGSIRFAEKDVRRFLESGRVGEFLD